MATVPLQELTFHSVVGTGADASDTTSAPARNAWMHGLCSCLSFPYSCCSVVFCEACTLGQATAVAYNGRGNVCIVVTLIALAVGGLYFGMNFVNETAVMVVGIVASILACLLVIDVRMRIRKARGIGGSLVEDGLLACFCGPCSICQILNEYQPYKGPFSTYEKVDPATPTSEVV